MAIKHITRSGGRYIGEKRKQKKQNESTQLILRWCPHYVLYGHETWTQPGRLESKMQAIETMCLRRVEGVTEEEVRKAFGKRQ